MAIQSNNSEEVVLGSGIQTYSGISNFEVIAVNPTMAELHALDVKVKQEPNYYIEMNGEEYFKLCFWIKNEDHWKYSRTYFIIKCLNACFNRISP